MIGVTFGQSVLGRSVAMRSTFASFCLSSLAWFMPLAVTQVATAPTIETPTAVIIGTGNPTGDEKFDLSLWMDFLKQADRQGHSIDCYSALADPLPGEGSPEQNELLLLLA